MANIHFNTSNETFRKLMGNGILYKVPMFQRDYSWTETEWEDLWQDIIEIHTLREPAHYLGYLVLKSDDTINFDIIDGQQRITTLSLLVLAVLKNLQRLQLEKIDTENNKIRSEQLRSSYIGYLDPVTLISSSKLKLNKHNDSLYQNDIVPLGNLPKRGLNSSGKLLKNAFEWFTEKVAKDISNKDGAEIARFISSIADGLFFTVITVTNELNAFKVFETLNARGVRLSTTDLLKNYLFSVVSNEVNNEIEINKIEEKWEIIVRKLSGEGFPDFVRAYWNSRNKLIRKTNLFKVIRSTIKNKQDVFDLIKKLYENADFYAALSNSEDELWTHEQKPYIHQLKIFSIRQPYPFLMIANKVLIENDFIKLLRACSIISFRYNVICNLHTGRQEDIYNEIAVKIAKGELITLFDIIQKLKTIYPDDDIFRAAFVEKELNSKNRKKVIRYILFALEKQLSGKDYDAESEKYTIEHILPESPEEHWIDFDENRDGSFIYRLGNYTLLTKKDNEECENKGFLEKLKIYKESEFDITREINNHYSSWDIKKIVYRQKVLAKHATAIWQLA